MTGRELWNQLEQLTPEQFELPVGDGYADGFVVRIEVSTYEDDDGSPHEYIALTLEEEDDDDEDPAIEFEEERERQ